MKQFFLVLITCYSLTASAQTPDTSGVTEAMTTWDTFFGKVDGKSLAPFIAETLEGMIVTNRDISAKATFINVWFASCAPCIQEIPHLKRIYKLFKDSADFKFYSITYETRGKAKEFMEKYGIDFPVLLVSKEVAKQMNFGRGYPTNLLLNMKGKVHTAYPALCDQNGAAEAYIKRSLVKLLANTAVADDLLGDATHTSNISFVDTSQEINSVNELMTHFKGKSLYVDLWASWCVPCRNEFLVKNSVDSFLKKHQIVRLFVSIDKPEAQSKWKDLIYSFGLDGYHLLAGDKLINDLKRKVYRKGEDSSIPRYLLIRNGKLIERAAYRPSEEQKLINQLSEKLLND